MSLVVRPLRPTGLVGTREDLARDLILGCDDGQAFVDALSEAGKRLKGDALELLVAKLVLITYLPIFKGARTVYNTREYLPPEVKRDLAWHFDEGAEIDVDLVVTYADGTYAAWQCKAHDKENLLLHDVRIIGWAQDESRRKKLRHVGIASTTTGCSSRIAREYPRAIEKVHWLLLMTLLEIDEGTMARVHASLRGDELPRPPGYDRRLPWQARAIRAALRDLRRKHRATVLSACGAGKSMNSYWVGRDLGAEFVALMVPNLTLNNQGAFDHWRQSQHERVDMDFLLVNSDPSSRRQKRRLTGGDGEVRVVGMELGAPVTTNASEGARYITQVLDAGRKLTAVVTYQSADKWMEMCHGAGRWPDLTIHDECHNLVGLRPTPARRLLLDHYYRTRNRLFTSGSQKTIADRAGRPAMFSMDNPTTFGPISFDYPYRDAVRERVVAPIKVHVVFVNQRALAEILNNRQAIFPKEIGRSARATEVVGAMAQLQVMKKYPTEATHAFGFDNRNENARRYLRILEGVGRFMGDRYKALMESMVLDNVTCDDIVAKRTVKLYEFANAPRGTMTVVRALAEGLNIPKANTLLFISPRKSAISVQQPVGRITRYERGKTAHIIVPIHIEKGQRLTDVRGPMRQIGRTLDYLGISFEAVKEQFYGRDGRPRVGGSIIQPEVDEEGVTYSLEEIQRAVRTQVIAHFTGGRLTAEDYHALAKARGFKWLGPARGTRR